MTFLLLGSLLVNLLGAASDQKIVPPTPAKPRAVARGARDTLGAGGAGPVVPSDREKFLTPEVEQAIDRGLEFLAARGARGTGGAGASSAEVATKAGGAEPTARQKKDGSIGLPPVGSTSIAILAFLANGHLPGKGLHGTVVQKGVEYLLQAQDPFTGLLGGGMYEHGFALLALADVWGEFKDEKRLLCRHFRRLRGPPGFASRTGSLF